MHHASDYLYTWSAGGKTSADKPWFSYRKWRNWTRCVHKKKDICDFNTVCSDKILHKHLPSTLFLVMCLLEWSLKRLKCTVLRFRNSFLAHLSKAQGELLWSWNVRRLSSVMRRSSSIILTTLQPIILIQSSSNLPRMFILKISRTSTNMGGVCLKL